MNTEHIKKQLAEKGTPISEAQAEKLLQQINHFCDSFREKGISLDWHYSIQQVGTDSFSIEYCHRETVEAGGEA